jgi:hypothetical protein
MGKMKEQSIEFTAEALMSAEAEVDRLSRLLKESQTENLYLVEQMIGWISEIKQLHAEIAVLIEKVGEAS